MEDKELVFSLRMGDKNAYKCLYEHYYSSLCIYANRFTNDRYESESIVNEVILAIWKNRENLLIERSFQNYLIRAVKNKCLNYLKKQATMQDLRAEIILEYSFVTNENVVQKILLNELQLRLEEALDKLPELTATIFRKSRFDNLKYHEIAAELDVSVDVVKYHIKSALSNLRISLKDFFLMAIFFDFF